MLCCPLLPVCFQYPSTRVYQRAICSLCPEHGVDSNAYTCCHNFALPDIYIGVFVQYIAFLFYTISSMAEHGDPSPIKSEGTSAFEAARQEKLYKKVMLLHCKLADDETRRAMAEPTGWRPELPTNISLETQIRILQARLDAKNASSS